MRIGVDVDGTLTDIQKYQIEKGEKYFNKSYDDTKLDVEQMFDCSKEEASKFWIKYIWEYCMKYPMIKEYIEALNKLKQEGNEIYIITRRVHTTEKGALGNIFRSMLIRSLKKNNVLYDDIIYCSSVLDKVDACNKLKIDYMLEDEVENIEEIIKNTDTKVLCRKQPYNEMIVENDKIKKISTASDIMEYITGEKDFIPKKFNKDQHVFTYNVVRSIGAPLFETLLHPTIINKEFIPKEGPIILCGNHLHVWDQFPTICGTNRVTHWMAKKEYFDSKMGPLFKCTGAISVDRFGNPHDAVNTALNYLEVNSAVGIFPEGTRNHPKEEKIKELYSLTGSNLEFEEFKNQLKQQSPLLSRINLLERLYNEGRISKNDFVSALFDIEKYVNECKDSGIISLDEYNDSLLLPFKFGAVSMAKKTSATLVPFGVTGSYEINSKDLVIRFGEPFKVNDDELEVANEKLRNKVLNLVIENKNMKKN